MFTTSIGFRNRSSVFSARPEKNSLGLEDRLRQKMTEKTSKKIANFNEMLLKIPISSESLLSLYILSSNPIPSLKKFICSNIEI